MGRTFAIIIGGLIGVVLFAGLVHAVLVATHLSQSAGATVNGFTGRRLWASMAALSGLAGVVIAGLALTRPASRFGTGSGRFGAIVAISAGFIAALNGALNLAVANGGPGTGNGVIGAAAAFVLGLIALGLGWLAISRAGTLRWNRGQ